MWVMPRCEVVVWLRQCVMRRWRMKPVICSMRVKAPDQCHGWWQRPDMRSAQQLPFSFFSSMKISNLFGNLGSNFLRKTWIQFSSGNLDPIFFGKTGFLRFKPRISTSFLEGSVRFSFYFHQRKFCIFWQATEFLRFILKTEIYTSFLEGSHF